ncbi:hypothetical protein ACB092_01G418000 [Castanea dentata]
MLINSLNSLSTSSHCCQPTPAPLAHAADPRRQSMSPLLGCSFLLLLLLLWLWCGGDCGCGCVGRSASVDGWVCRHQWAVGLWVDRCVRGGGSGGFHGGGCGCCLVDLVWAWLIFFFFFVGYGGGGVVVCMVVMVVCSSCLK